MIFLTTMEKQREIHLADGTVVPHAMLAPIIHLMRTLSAKWKLEILFAINEGHARFGEIMRATPGITQHMLATRLRELQREGFIDRHDYGESPPRVEYSLTEASQALRPSFEALMLWARAHAPEIVPARRERIEPSPRSARAPASPDLSTPIEE